jgi:hypothetical protein
MVTHELRKESEVLAFVSNPTRNNSGTNLELSRELINGVRRGTQICVTALPVRAWNQNFSGELISFFLNPFLLLAEFNAFVHDCSVSPAVKVLPGMDKFVHKGKPEIVQAIFTQCQANHWRAPAAEHRCAIQMSSGKVWLYHHSDTSVLKKSYGQAGAIRHPAEPRHITNQFFRQ